MKKKTTKKRGMLVREKKILMDTLLDYENERQKLSNAQHRLWKREERLDVKRNEVVKKLAEGIKGNEEELNIPIFYKGNNFQLEQSGWNSNIEYSIEIQGVKKL